MGYNIEVSFNVLKHNIHETKELISNIAVENGCENYYNEYEFEKNLCYSRNHCVFTFIFQDYNIDDIVKFLKKMKNLKGIYVESIYDDDRNNMLFASNLYLSQFMDKHIAKVYKMNKRERSYSEDDIKILNTIQKLKCSS
jgi:hypothetical protein